MNILIMKPIVVVNFKTYPEATGEKAVKLAQLCEWAGQEYNVDMRVAVQATDLTIVSRAVKIPVYAQHVDSATTGRNTGWITAYAIKVAGASGTLLNHSERHVSTQSIRSTTPHLRKEKLGILVIADSVERLHEMDAHVDADLFSVEPPELIAGEVSVSVAKPDVVVNAVHATKKPLLIGAGVRDYNDLKIALELGAKGVLLSSNIVLAKDQKRALQKLLTLHGR